MNNGYASIVLNGAEVGLKFGLPCFSEMIDKPLPTDAVGSSVYTAELLFAAYKNNCLIKRVAPTLDFEPFYEYVEDSFIDAESSTQLNEVVQIFHESKFVKAGKEIIGDGTKKKNGQQTTSNPSATDSSD